MFLLCGWIAQFCTIVVSILCLCRLFRIYMVSSTIAVSLTACGCSFVVTVFCFRIFFADTMSIDDSLATSALRASHTHGQFKRVSCASALCGFGAPVFTTVTVRCVPIVGVGLSVCWSFRCVLCGNASPWFVVCFMSTVGEKHVPVLCGALKFTQSCWQFQHMRRNMMLSCRRR